MMKDFSARSGRDNIAWPCALGTHGTGEVNVNNKKKPVKSHTQHEFFFTNTFKISDAHKPT